MIGDAFCIELKNELPELEVVREIVEQFCRSLGLTKKTIFQITFCIEEIFVNIVSYGYDDQAVHAIRFTLSHDNGELTLLFEDDGFHFNPLAADPPNLKIPIEERKVGGLGVHLTKQLMNDIAYERRNNKNILTMKKYLTQAC